jgi:ABC-type multidrug transport system fused ATPase/permease subunit
MTRAFLFECAKLYRGRLLLAGLLTVAESLALLALPWIAGHAAQHFLSGSDRDVRPVIFGLVGVLALQAVLRFANRYVAAGVAADLLASLRNRIFQHLQSLPLSFHQQRRQGETLALLTHDVAHLSSFLSGTLVQLVPLCLTAAGAVVLMLRLDATLAVLVGALVPVFYVALKITGRRLRTLAQQSREAEAGAVAIAEESLGMMAAIKSFACEDRIAARYATQMQSIARLSRTQGRVQAALGPAIEFLTGTAAIGLLALASRSLLASGMTAAEVVSFFLYAVLLTRPISRLAGLYGQVQLGRGALARLEAVLEVRPDRNAGVRRSPPSVAGAVSFQDVCFAYPGRPDAIRHFSLDIAAGETVALTGHNGAGKSTLAHLLLRLYEPDSGRILLDGQDIATLDLQWLRRQIGLVPQQVALLNATIAENIAFADPNAPAERIEAAARIAEAYGFISELPQGFATMIGDHGVRLSGGQRQRIALARAVLKNAPVLVLDEATAMFDPEGERAFIETAREAFADRTVILITHRPASLALADRIVRVDHGTAVARSVAA